MESQRLSQLIGLIYDAALDLDLWPLLLQGLMAESLAASLPAVEMKLIPDGGHFLPYSHWHEIIENEANRAWA